MMEPTETESKETLDASPTRRAARERSGGRTQGRAGLDGRQPSRRREGRASGRACTGRRPKPTAAARLPSRLLAATRRGAARARPIGPGVSGMRVRSGRYGQRAANAWLYRQRKRSVRRVSAERSIYRSPAPLRCASRFNAHLP